MNLRNTLMVASVVSGVVMVAAVQAAEKIKAVVASKEPAVSIAPVKIPSTPAVADDSKEHDDAAAMLLGLDDEPGTVPHVPDGSTVMEIAAVNADGTPIKKTDKKKTISGAEMSNAANDILRKYIRRTGN